MAETANRIGFRIDNGRLELMSILGVGAYGVVYLAKDVKSPTPAYYAVKCLSKLHLDSRQRSFQRREIALHTLAGRHPHVCTLHGVIECPTAVYVILDYLPGGDLFGCITDRQLYLGKDDLITSVFAQIVEAVDFCHQTGIFHRDLKPENILCSVDGKRVVLADFGLATTDKTSTDFGCGSTFYMSPECQGGLFTRLGCYSTRHNDIWSLGVILVNLTCGRNPWKVASPSDETFQAYLHNPDFLRSILPISHECNDLLKRIFCLNPQGRISLKELKEELRRIRRWTMTEDELRHATRATRDAARAWCPDVPDDGESSVQSDLYAEEAEYGVVEETEFTETETETETEAGLVWYQHHPEDVDGSTSGSDSLPSEAGSSSQLQWSADPHLNGQQPIYKHVDGALVPQHPAADFHDAVDYPYIVAPPSAPQPQNYTSPRVQPPTPVPAVSALTPRPVANSHFVQPPETPSRRKAARSDGTPPHPSAALASTSAAHQRTSSPHTNGSYSDASRSGSLTRSTSDESMVDATETARPLQPDHLRVHRHRKSSTCSSVSSASTNSSTWVGLPPTPDVPRFSLAEPRTLDASSKGKAPASNQQIVEIIGKAGSMYADDDLDITFAENTHTEGFACLQPSPSVTSSKASYKANYAAYAHWAEAIAPPAARAPRRDAYSPRSAASPDYGLMEMAKRAAQHLVGSHAGVDRPRGGSPQQPITVSPLRQ